MVVRSRVAPEAPWSPLDSAELYQVDSWGQGYFHVNNAGHVVVRPGAGPGPQIDLFEVVEELRSRGLSTPYLVRFSDILAHRIRRLHEAFTAAIAENDYRGRYLAVYPIKVNQRRQVVEEVYSYGRPYGFGLEVGSKPELLAVMALASDEPQRPIVCNGFKDEGYIEAVILATKLGRTMIPVVENPAELGIILEHARRYGVRPRIGVRLKLTTRGAGRWGGSAGSRSKFGLFVSEILEVFDILKREGLEGCLELVHCHPGSQVQDIRRLKDMVSELAAVYVELARMGAGVRYLDVGGGLGVDYRGAQIDDDSSMNYTLEEYAADVVYRVASACDDADVEHPTILSESGRAMVAYHSVLVFEVVGATGLRHFRVPERLAELEKELEAQGDEVPQPVYDLFDAQESISQERLLECFHDAVQARKEAMQLFRLGYISLRLRGLADRLFWSVCVRAREISSRMATVPEGLRDLEVILSDIYFCNFSVFQSMPDAWAVEQLFPVLPIHRLGERPTAKAVLADITCDSDGKIDRFSSGRGVKAALDVHPLRASEPYYLGAFLAGAYQETLGDLHNLFGDTHVAKVRLDPRGGWQIEEILEGDSAAEVLGYVQYEVERLFPSLAADCDRAVKSGSMTAAESEALLGFYREELEGYTYLERE